MVATLAQEMCADGQGGKMMKKQTINVFETGGVDSSYLSLSLLAFLSFLQKW